MKTKILNSVGIIQHTESRQIVVDSLGPIRERETRAMATCSCHPNIRRLLLQGNKSKREFLIDTGADVSLSFYQNITKGLIQLIFTFTLRTIPSKIPVYGKKMINVDLGLRRSFTYNSYIANVQNQIIGTDFLTHFNLLVDLPRKRICYIVFKAQLYSLSKVSIAA